MVVPVLVRGDDGAEAGVPDEGALRLADLQSLLDIRQQFGTAPPLGTSLERYYETSYYREARGQ